MCTPIERRHHVRYDEIILETISKIRTDCTNYDKVLSLLLGLETHIQTHRERLLKEP